MYKLLLNYILVLDKALSRLKCLKSAAYLTAEGKSEENFHEATRRSSTEFRFERLKNVGKRLKN